MYSVLVEKPKERYHLEDNVKVYVQGAGWQEEWIGVFQCRDTWQAVMLLWTL
jgi:hypothetical protein